MVIIYNGGFIATPQATHQGVQSLVELMHHAIGKWIKDGKPLSGSKED